MFTGDVRSMLVQVLTSWQVLAATVVLIFYIFLVNYVANLRNRPGKPSKFKRKRKIPKPQFPSAPEIVPGDDELGLDDPMKL